jgi:hypothetical protein
MTTHIVTSPICYWRSCSRETRSRHPIRQPRPAGLPRCFSAVGKRPTQHSRSIYLPRFSGKHPCPALLSVQQPTYAMYSHAPVHQYMSTLFYTAYTSKHATISPIASVVPHASMCTFIFWLSSWCRAPCVRCALLQLAWWPHMTSCRWFVAVFL